MSFQYLEQFRPIIINGTRRSESQISYLLLYLYVLRQEPTKHKGTKPLIKVPDLQLMQHNHMQKMIKCQVAFNTLVHKIVCDLHERLTKRMCTCAFLQL